MRLATFSVQVALPEVSDADHIRQAIEDTLRQETIRWFDADVALVDCSEETRRAGDRPMRVSGGIA